LWKLIEDFKRLYERAWVVVGRIGIWRIRSSYVQQYWEGKGAILALKHGNQFQRLKFQRIVFEFSVEKILPWHWNWSNWEVGKMLYSEIFQKWIR